MSMPPTAPIFMFHCFASFWLAQDQQRHNTPCTPRQCHKPLQKVQRATAAIGYPIAGVALWTFYGGCNIWICTRSTHRLNCDWWLTGHQSQLRQQEPLSTGVSGRYQRTRSPRSGPYPLLQTCHHQAKLLRHTTPCRHSADLPASITFAACDSFNGS